MPTVSLPAPPEPFACKVCEGPLAHKAGPSCKDCPAFTGTHYFPGTWGKDACDIVVVVDKPEEPYKPKNTLLTVVDNSPHRSFIDPGSTVLNRAIESARSLDPAFTYLGLRWLYAVKCAIRKPHKGTLLACNSYLKQELSQVLAGRQMTGRTRPVTIIACGIESLRALGVQVKGERDALGRVYENVQVLPSLMANIVFVRSVAAIAATPGKYNSLVADVERAFRFATQKQIVPFTQAELEKTYHYPRTVEELRKLVDYVIEYGGPDHLISFDTETNTRYPQLPLLECIMVSFAWDDQQAAAVPLWHPEFISQNGDAAGMWVEVLRLINSGKPLTWHGFQYDFKVFWAKGYPKGMVGNTRWDTLLGEHVLEEDKKQGYGLKPLTREFHPRYANYEDQLRLAHELTPDTDDDETAKANLEAAARQLPQVLQDALKTAMDRGWIRDAEFQARTLGKAKKQPDVTAEDAQIIDLLLTAKANGEFKALKGVSTDPTEDKGGYEKIDLKTLQFYAAIDADVGRQQAILQFNRMDDETEKLSRWQAYVERQIAIQTPGQDLQGKAVYRRAPCAKPLQHLLQHDYIPRQIELAKVEYAGIRIDLPYLKQSQKDLVHTLAATREKIFELCGEPFKLGSSAKKANFLFFGGRGYRHPDPALAEEMAATYPEDVEYKDGLIRYRSQHYTREGAMQASTPVFKHLVARYKDPLANLLLSQGKADKLHRSFLVNIEKLAGMFGGRVHPGYLLHGTTTGRLASSSGVPKVGFNSQNLVKGWVGAYQDYQGNPILNDQGEPIFKGVSCKKLFLPDDDSMAFGNADAKGAEVTCMTAYSSDAALHEAMMAGLDPHAFFASTCLRPELVCINDDGTQKTGAARREALEKAGIDEDHAWSYEDFIWGKDYEPDKDPQSTPAKASYAKRLKKLRDSFKRVVFGMLYGAGPEKIAETAGVSVALAQRIISLLFTKFPDLERFMAQARWELRMFGIVQTWHGRARRFNIKNAPKKLQARAERQALNFFIQSTSSDIVMSVLTWIAPILERDMGGRLLITVHDSLGFQVPKQYVHQIPELFKHYGTKEVARRFPWLPVPYRWDVELGDNYGELSPAHKYIAGERAHLPPAELQGYIEEEMFDAMRNPDSIEVPPLRHPPMKAA